MREITLTGNKIADKINAVGVNLMPEFVAFGNALHTECERANLSLNKLFPELVSDGLKLGKSMTYLASQASATFGNLGYLPHISIFRLKEFLPLYGKMPRNASQRDRVRFWTLASDMRTEVSELANRFGIIPTNNRNSDASEKKPLGEMPDDRIHALVQLIVRGEKVPVLISAILEHIDGNKLISMLAAEQKAKEETAKKEREIAESARMTFTI